MTFRRKSTEIERHRELTIVVAGFGARLDAMESRLAKLQLRIAELPARIAWAQRYLEDAHEHPELLTALAAEVAAWQAEHPAEFGEMLRSITERADA